MEDLTLEVNSNFVKGKDSFQIGGGTVIITPPIDGDYWAVRVRVSEAQSIVAFPKFGTYGMGFQLEDDWNTNLPYTCNADEILGHIMHNKGDDSISYSDCLRAIRMIRNYLYLMNGDDVLEELKNE